MSDAGRQPVLDPLRVHNVQAVTVGFDELFREEYPKLVALGVSMSGDREVARDLAQETMVRAHDHWEQVESYDAPQAWLRRVMSNLLIDHHRSRTAERAAVERLGHRSPVGGEISLPSRWSELIAPLTPLQRVVATLYYADDLSVADVASTLDISEGTVKSTLSKVRDRLRRLRNDHGEGWTS